MKSAVCIALIACSGQAFASPKAPHLLNASAKSQPDWVRATPEKPGRRYFMGSSQKESLASGIDAATQDAWNQAAQAAGAEVSSSYHEEESKEATEAKSRIQVASFASIQGLTVEQRYVEEWGGGDSPGYARVWVLASMPEASYRQAILDAHEKIEELKAHRQGRRAEVAKELAVVETLILQGRQQEASGFEERAREDFRRAQGALQLAGVGETGADPDTQDRMQALLAELQTELTQKGLGLADFKAAVAQLAAVMKESDAPAAVVRATYQGSAFGGALGPKMIQLVEDELTRRAPGKVVPHDTFLTRLSRLKIALEDLAGVADAAQLSRLGVHSVIYVNYYPRPDGVELSLSLQSPGSGVLLAKAQAFLPESQIGDATPAPQHLEVAESVLATLSSAQGEPQGLGVKLWPDHGESSTYTEGQLIVLHARVDKDCHLYLIHADSDGGIQMLYPNQLHPSSSLSTGDTVDVPAASDDFQFRATQPYGGEVIVAIAAQDPLPSLESKRGQGFADLGSGAAALQRVVRDYLRLLPSHRGMSRTVYTTVGSK